MHALRVVSRGGRSRISAIALAVLAMTVVAAPASAGDISGTAFADSDRDAVLDLGEAPFGDHRIYVFGADGTYRASALTQPDGGYTVSGLADGDYVVQYAAPSWWAVRDEWVPTTTGGSLRPRVEVRLSGSATADFGWRRIVRSTQATAPITRFTGPSGLTVMSYNDVVTAQELHDRLTLGLIGPEATSVTVRFDLGGGTSTSSSVGSADGRYDGFAALCSIAYVTWLDESDVALSHEYGHAWSLYHAYITQQDPAMNGYLEARGLTGDPRLNSSYEWAVRELIAEDYRQLLGSPSARNAPQTNRELPSAEAVPGLREYLAGAFSQTPAPPSVFDPPAPMEVTGLAMNPDPVSTAGTVSYSLSAPGQVTARILTGHGALVRTIVADSAQAEGLRSLRWDRTNTAGRRVKRGTYQVVVEAADSYGRTAAMQIRFSVA